MPIIVFWEDKMNIACIFAGGVGSRMRSKEIPKQFLCIHGKPIIIHTLEIFENHKDIDCIVVACKDEWIDHLRKLLEKFKITKVKCITGGGKTGQLSIYNTLIEAEKLTSDDNSIVLIHDGVRPLITEKTITDNIKSVMEFGSCITSVKVKETIMLVSEDNSIDYIPDRANSRLARAPQSFYLKDILKAHRAALSENIDNFIDSCSMMQYYGKKMYLVDGPDENIKITTPGDFYIMRAILDAREDNQIYGLGE